MAGDPSRPRRPATGARARAALCDWCAHQALCPEWGGTPPPLPTPEPAATEGATEATTGAATEATTGAATPDAPPDA